MFLQVRLIRTILCGALSLALAPWPTRAQAQNSSPAFQDTAQDCHVRLALPVLGTVGATHVEVQTTISVQNVGDAPTQAVLVVWASGQGSAAVSDKPLAAICSPTINPGVSWQIESDAIPSGTRSGLLYSVDPIALPEAGDDVQACHQAFAALVAEGDAWQTLDEAFQGGTGWQGLDWGTGRGQPLAVQVLREAMGAAGEASLSAAYAASCAADDGSGEYSYFAPLLATPGDGFSSRVYVQNVGVDEASIGFVLLSQDESSEAVECDRQVVAPGHSVSFVAADCVEGEFTGTVRVSAGVPLALVVDRVGDSAFTSESIGSAPLAGTDAAVQVIQLPLHPEGDKGADSLLFVQNLKADGRASVLVQWLDEGGEALVSLSERVGAGRLRTWRVPLPAAPLEGRVVAVRVQSQPLQNATPAPLAVYLESVAYGSGPDSATQQAVAFSGTVGQGSDTRWAIPRVYLRDGGRHSTLVLHNANANPGHSTLTIEWFNDQGQYASTHEQLEAGQTRLAELPAPPPTAAACLSAIVRQVDSTQRPDDCGASAVVVYVEQIESSGDGRSAVRAMAIPARATVDLLTDVGGLREGQDALMSSTTTHKLQVQQGVDGRVEDTYLSSSAEETNYATEALLRVGYGQCYVSLLRFDLSALPGNAAIETATLELYARGWSGGNLNLSAFALRRSAQFSRASWNEAAPAMPWASPGASESDADREGGAEAALLTHGVSQWYSFDITGAVQRWADGAPNYGLLVQDEDSRHAFFFASSECSDAWQRPKLLITFR